jgi:hypothetical protein
MRALIDADVLTYSIGSFTNPHPFLKDADGEKVLMPCSSAAIHAFCEADIVKIMEGAGCDSYELFISHDDNFRKEVAKTHPYKFKRADNEKPYHHATVKDYFVDVKGATVVPGIEADDALALAQTMDTVICTIDKDLLMVPGLHWNWRKDELKEVDYDEGLHWFLTQLLTGDWSTDSIIGCGHVEDKVYGPKAKKAGQGYQARVGIGPKAAENLLMGVSGLAKLEVVKVAYQAEFGMGWKMTLNEMANLLGMGLSRDNLWSYDERSKDYRKILPCLGAEQVNAGADTGAEF